MLVSKDVFVDCIMKRMSKNYTLLIHSIGILFCISLSFWFTFLDVEYFKIEYLSIITDLNSAGINTAIKFLSLTTKCLVSFFISNIGYRLVFKGFSYSSFTFYVRFRYSPIDFVKILYFCISILAIAISSIGFDFIRNGNVSSLTPLVSFYYVLGVISTTGSDVYPNSNVTEVLSIAFSFLTLYLVVFVFQKSSEIKLSKKIISTYSNNRLDRFYDKLLKICKDKSLTVEQTSNVFNYFITTFNFYTPDGVDFITLQLESGESLYRIAATSYNID